MNDNGQNTDILAIYNSLCDQQDALRKAIQDTDDPQLAKTIATESQEIAHRILLAQNLLFLADSAKLKNAADSVTKSSTTLATTIAEIQSATTLLNSISSYLVDVDQAIDLAKTLAAAV